MASIMAGVNLCFRHFCVFFFCGASDPVASSLTKLLTVVRQTENRFAIRVCDSPVFAAFTILSRRSSEYGFMVWSPVVFHKV